MKNLKIKSLAVASAFVVGNLLTLVANATATNYLDGLQYSVNAYSGNTSGVINSSTSLTINNGNFPPSSLAFPLRDFTTNPPTPTYTPTLAAGTYTFSFNYAGPAGVFGSIGTNGCSISGGGNNLPQCPSNISVFYRPQGATSSTYLNDGLAVTVGTNNLSFTLANAAPIYLGMTLWEANQTYTISNILLTDGTIVQVVTPSVNLAPNAYALRSVYNIQSAALNAGLSYDCNVFDKEGICLSTGGRYSTTNSPETTTTSGLLIGSYQYDKNVRLGAWVDQNLSTNNTDGVKLSNNEPLFGVFGAWSERNDGLGYEVKVSAGYGDKDVEVTRTEANQGSAKINSRGIQTVSSFGVAIDGDWIAAPYVGAKYLSVKRGAYTEGGSSALTYDTLRQETTSAMAGVKFTGKIDPQTFTVLSAGVEHDLDHNVGQYSATSGDSSEFNSNIQKTRPVVSAGIFYDIDKTQRLGLNATHRQEAFQSTATTSLLATYTVGL